MILLLCPRTDRKDKTREVWPPIWLNSMAIMASRFQTLFFKLCKELKLKSKKDRVSTISYCVLYAKQYTNMSYACMIADHSQAAYTGPPWPAWSLFCVYARLFWKLKLIQLFLSFYRWLEQHYKLFFTFDILSAACDMSLRKLRCNLKLRFSIQKWHLITPKGLVVWWVVLSYLSHLYSAEQIAFEGISSKFSSL